ncbi:hypothetical protein EMIHUDRAFT_237702 [Emiliania huxleyi CCMP1516]|uniref:Magnesium transporter n=2 Tax=Emiliania huxleyi TaxID=2903 RepID=A0A0D3JPN6_EMIH1|nr:hypothetical protein EMIHUDRAFT_237702 [Emiliania huxleyi CCMP1516]EOD25471.1 hypothetical protein EMIHUDRAFT_237702 [Emiliania huxleyi CCMP1516]|eukprot:XP_005777900.1 hypothetical protein EMIHUDRAFT_237702 [Emiliania huxleyi CCMP1516]
MQRWPIGLLLDAVATLAGTGGKQLLRHAALTGKHRYYALGLILTAVIDPIFDVAAYTYAAQSIIAAAAGLVVVWNVLLAPYTLGEALTRERKLGSALIFSGTLLVGVSGSHAEVERTPAQYLSLFARPEACAYYASFAAWIAVCAARLCRVGAGKVERGFLVAAAAGSLGGNTFTTKAASELLASGAADPECDGCPFRSPAFYLLAGCTAATASTALLLLGLVRALDFHTVLREHDALFAITVYSGFYILSGALRGKARTRRALSGNFVMDEKRGRPAASLAAYCASDMRAREWREWREVDYGNVSVLPAKKSYGSRVSRT